MEMLTWQEYLRVAVVLCVWLHKIINKQHDRSYVHNPFSVKNGSKCVTNVYSKDVR